MKTKKVGFWILTGLVVGNMIGSGIFLLPSSLAAIGSITLYSWLLTTIGSIFLALVFAKLSTLFKETGGPYIYSQRAFGDFVGFQVAYNYWVYMWVGNAAVAVALTGYLSPFWPQLTETPLLGYFVTIGFVWLFTFINALGVHFAGIFQLITSILKLVPLLVIICFGFFYFDPEHFRAFNITGESNFSALSKGAILTLWAFLGLESACIPAEDVENPAKNIPRATMAGTLISAVVYILSTVAIMGLIAPAALAKSSAPFSDAARVIFGPWGEWIVSIGAVIACIGALNGWILLQGQVPYAAAKEGLFPSVFAKKSKQGVPLIGMLISSTLVSIILYLNFHKSLVDQFTFVILLATLAAIIAYLYCSIGEIIILIQRKNSLGKQPLWVAIGLIAFAYSFWAFYGAGQQMVFYGSALVMSSIPIYSWLVAYKAKKTAA